MNGIEIYQNAFSKEYCQAVIQTFDSMSANMQTLFQNNIHKNEDERIVLDWAPTANMFYQEFNICQHFYEVIHKHYVEHYAEKYSILKTLHQHTPKGMSVQKTMPYQGYHAWHTEVGHQASANRVITYTLYLNDVEEGGETEFLYQGVKIRPETGKLVFFPTGYTHPHRGNPIYSGEKYIISGWYTFDH